MKSSKIDIIIPVHNTGSILNKCLTSIHKQSFTNWTCIIVNDNSVNNDTIRIIDKWCRLDSRFTCIHKKRNEGVDCARFTGIESSNSDYITFVDSDDWLELNALSRLLQASKEYDADVVVGRSKKCYSTLLSKRNDVKQKIYEGHAIDHYELMQKYMISFFGCNILPVNVWGTLYTRSLIEKAAIRPTKLKFGEDLMFNLNLFPYINRYYAIEDCIYNYNAGIPGAHPSKYMSSWLRNATTLFEYKWRILEKYDNQDAAIFQAIEMKNYIATYIRFCITNSPKIRKQHIKTIEETLKHPVYEKMTVLADTKYETNDFTSSIIEKNAEHAYTIMEEQLRKSPLKEKIIGFILKCSSKACSLLQ